MKKLQNYACVNVTDKFLALPEIQEICRKYKSVGFTAVVMLQLELSKHKNSIGRISNLRPISHTVGVQLRTLIDIMNESNAFVMDYEHDIFYMPRLRKKFHLGIKLTEEEIDDVCRHGNVYFGNGKEERTSENISKKIQKRFQKSEEQESDNQEDTILCKDKDKEDKCNDIKIKKEALRNDVSPCTDDDADAAYFKKSLSLRSWRRSISKRQGINMDNDTLLGIFAEWMYYYCCSCDKTMRDAAELRRYAANLLRHGSRTRAEFDSYCEEQMTENMEITQEDAPAADYESVRDGIRYSCEGQMIPDAAPRQPAPSMAFSYVRNLWIPLNEYEINAETTAFDRNIAENQHYIRAWKSTACRY